MLCGGIDEFNDFFVFHFCGELKTNNVEKSEVVDDIAQFQWKFHWRLDLP